MKPTLAFDYDGVIANTNRLKSQWIAEYLGRDVAPGLCDRTRCVPIIGLDTYNLMSNEVYGREASLRAQPMPGAVEGIQALSQKHRLAIITARDEERLQWTREWLQNRDLARFFSVVRSSVGTSKPEIVTELGALSLVDDDPRHLRGAPEAPFARLLFAQGAHPDGIEPEITVVSDWPALVAALEGLSPSTSIV